MWSDMKSVLHDHGVDFDAFGVPIIWIRIRRDDHVAQAVSYARAGQTQRWRAGEPEYRVPIYDSDQIAQFCDRIEPENAAWDDYLAARGASPIQVTYGDSTSAHDDESVASQRRTRAPHKHQHYRRSRLNSEKRRLT